MTRDTCKQRWRWILNAVSGGLSAQEAAKLYDVDVSYVYRICGEHGFSCRDIERRLRVYMAAAVDRGCVIKNVANVFGVSEPTVRRAVRQFAKPQSFSPKTQSKVSG